MRSLIVFSMALLLWSCAYAAAPVLDGRDWLASSEESKDSFISGFVAGSNYVIWGNLEMEGEKDAAGAEEKVLSKYLLEAASPGGTTFEVQEVTVLRDLAAKRAAEETNKNLVAFSIQLPSKAIISALDEFYGEEKNRAVKVADAIYFIKRKLSGASGAEIEDLLSSLRDGERMDSRRLLVKSEGGALFLP